MKALIPPRLSNAQEKAMKREINHQIIEHQKKWDSDFEAMIAYTLFTHYGFTAKKLKNFRKFFIEEYQFLKEYYEMDNTYPAKHILKEIGYDVDALIAEDERKAKND